MKAAPDAFRFIGFQAGRPVERFVWKRVRHHAPHATWPSEGAYLRMDYEAPADSPLGPGEPQSSDTRTSPIVDAAKTARAARIRVSVHYELYDGVPVMSKWITVHNPMEKRITVDRFTSEMLAVVEHARRCKSGSTIHSGPNGALSASSTNGVAPTQV